jgi:hypothetical protein
MMRKTSSAKSKKLKHGQQGKEKAKHLENGKKSNKQTAACGIGGGGNRHSFASRSGPKGWVCNECEKKGMVSS